MNKEFSFDISNLYNLFTSNQIDLKTCELNQIHSDTIVIVGDNFKNNTDGDAMITTKKNTPLVIKTADCIPIILYDKENQVLALVHSGWKGTLKSIASKTVKKMIEKYHTNPHDIKVYLYPSIRQCHFEIEDDVYKLFKEEIINIDKYTTKKGNKYHLDLQGIVIDSLRLMGIEDIHDSKICTYCHHQDFYSYRYNHTDKRNYLIGMIKE